MPSHSSSAKMMAAHQLSYLTLFLLTIAVYFMWMDVALYINVQQVRSNNMHISCGMMTFCF